MNATATEAPKRVNIFDLLDNFELTDEQENLAYDVYDLTRQLKRKLDEMASDIERAQRQLAEGVIQLIPSAVNPQLPMAAAVLNTQIEATRKAAKKAGVPSEVLAQAAIAGTQR